MGVHRIPDCRVCGLPADLYMEMAGHVSGPEVHCCYDHVAETVAHIRDFDAWGTARAKHQAEMDASVEAWREENPEPKLVREEA